MRLGRVLDRRCRSRCGCARRSSVGRSCSASKSWNARSTCVEVVRVGDGRHVPAVGDEPRGDVLGERDVRVALDRHPVRVVDPAEVREPLVRGERRRLGRDSLHHAAVPGLRVDVEVEERVPVAVVARAEPLARDGHADRRRGARPERARRRLDAARPAVLGMARAPSSRAGGSACRSSSETAGVPRTS